MMDAYQLNLTLCQRCSSRLNNLAVADWESKMTEAKSEKGWIVRFGQLGILRAGGNGARSEGQLRDTDSRSARLLGADEARWDQKSYKHTTRGLRASR